MKTRRSFLKEVTAASVFLPLVGKLHKDSARPVRVAFCGLGSYASRCAEAIKDSKNIQIAGVITGTPSKIKEWSEKYKLPAHCCYTYERIDELKNNPDIDVVYVTSVNSAHHPHTLAAARAGKHVICEKPMAIDVREAEEMIAVCRQQNVKLLIGYRLHFEPFTRELIRMRSAGELGQLSFVNATMGFRMGDPNQWRLKKALAGGGALYDVGIYCINGARYATGQEPSWVSAQELKTDPVKFSEVDETITWQMGFPGGVIAHCATTYNFNNFDRLYVAGNKDYFELSPAFGYGPLQARTGKGAVDRPVVTHQTRQLEGMADHLLTGAPLPDCNGEEGLKDMKIMEAIYESVRRGGEKIQLNL